MMNSIFTKEEMTEIARLLGLMVNGLYLEENDPTITAYNKAKEALLNHE